MTDVQILDPAFQRYILPNAALKWLTTGLTGRKARSGSAITVACCFPTSRMTASGGGGLTTFRAPSHFANSHTRDRQWRLVSCEHGTRRVTRAEWDGTITVLADTYDGKRLNSPNDVIVARDGSVWFSDPHYGTASDCEGHRGDDQPFFHRAEPQRGAVALTRPGRG